MRNGLKEAGLFRLLFPKPQVEDISLALMTLKALANFSPGLLQLGVQVMLKRFFATLEELRLLCDATLSGLRFPKLRPPLRPRVAATLGWN